MARGDAAGIFTLAVDRGRPVMALGGDLGAPDQVVERNAAVSRDGGSTWSAASPAPLAGAVYGSSAGGASWLRAVVAVAPGGGVFTVDHGVTWHAVEGLSAWAVEFAGGGRTGWAVGGGGRIWRIDWR